MVFYFKARPEAGDYTIFMGLDKYENEELIKYGFPEDIWFHVDKMSSAHVYLRLHKGQTIDDISEGVLEDCAQLVKANSIQGNKVNNIDVVYTPWANLKKTASMDVGQVGFHNSKMVRTVRVEKRINEIVNRLNKTKVERKPDLKAEREAVSAAERAERKLHLRDKKRREEMDRLEKERQAETRSYKGLMVAEKMTSNKQIASENKSLQELEDDFIISSDPLKFQYSGFEDCLIKFYVINSSRVSRNDRLAFGLNHLTWWQFIPTGGSLLIVDLLVFSVTGISFQFTNGKVEIELDEFFVSLRTSAS
ncbi:unnamed protein product [Dovyalis caffra]|uniref:NFACT RNA-binding domain-containing protein n=1 Tax=Dovyalis caffra TaxID=77055 RepID=A0AAV1SNU6_9ROSI|nr:unnamed protein product [Dovyalis caffra]